MYPIYSQVSHDFYEIRLGHKCIACMYRGKAGCYLIADNGFKRFETTRDAEQSIQKASRKLIAKIEVG